MDDERLMGSTGGASAPETQPIIESDEEHAERRAETGHRFWPVYRVTALQLARAAFVRGFEAQLEKLGRLRGQESRNAALTAWASLSQHARDGLVADAARGLALIHALGC